MVPRVPFAEEDGAAWEELHVVGRDGTSRGFVTGAVNVSGIKWLPDGKSIALLARRGSDQTIVSITTSAAGRPTRDPGGNTPRFLAARPRRRGQDRRLRCA